MKFKWKMGKDKWLILLAAGMLLLVITLPTGSKTEKKTAKNPDANTPFVLREGQVTQVGEPAAAAASDNRTYEQQLEQRVKQILKDVEGVGTVDVMIVLKSSGEKVLRVDRHTTDSTTQEQDGGGGTRNSSSAERQESTILTGSGENTTPFVEKEVYPEIEGIMISAQGGGSPTIKAEISNAMEALFNLPPHKIMVLKRIG